jgi:predicted O-methyltransferase YrrM
VIGGTIGHLLLWRLGLASPQTQTTEAERDAIERHASGAGVAVEIGVWHGVTTARIRRAMRRDGELVAVDPYPVGRLGFSAQRMIAQSELGRESGARIEWVRLTGAEAARAHAPRLHERVDLIFIDGDHSYQGLSGDWLGWASTVKPGGVVALHDSRSTPRRDIASAGSVRFTDEVVRRDPRFEIAEEVDSLTVWRRVSARQGGSERP